jgi:signal transduction histidine kinase
MVLADLGLISQAVANYLGNAVKYTKAPEDGGPPQLRCEVAIVPNIFPHRGSGVKVSVCTTGPAIPFEDEPHLFENSYRASNSKGEHGTGHGLFFVREIVAEHHGISGYERTLEGNNFYFILPLEK